nr:Chain C, GLU-PHE-GLU-ASP-LEU-THR-PHE-LEU-ALA [unidentified influenza virus]5NQ3_C Chain C, GLU-PHE-GLU-ASP-LEU-THR-PHE-LEU-ALA [unidentified influenza virus]5NQ3_F Chain F, GLU-PHE-GLU-ASP-LEU-THR-PHE-LEU-ALA [unidentified influenza virus]
EFEDLTFLA